MTMDLHADQIQGFFEVPVDHLYASELFIEDIKNLNLENLVIASPDMGGTKRANAYSKLLNSGVVVCYKERKKANVIGEMKILGDVEGKDVVIIDDMVDTAGTLTKAADLMLQQGATSVRAYCTHGVLSKDAYQKIDNSNIAELVITNTIPKEHKSKKVRDKISCLVKHRIKEIDKHKVCAKDVLGQALLPYNTPTFMHQLWDTADNMWIGIGDKTPHSDTNYYTKRIILCGVIASSIMFWVSDKGNEVDEFIDRRINDALKLGKIKKPESLKILKQFSKFMPHINHPLKMRD